MSLPTMYERQKDVQDPSQHERIKVKSIVDVSNNKHSQDYAEKWKKGTLAEASKHLRRKNAAATKHKLLPTQTHTNCCLRLLLLQHPNEEVTCTPTCWHTHVLQTHTKYRRRYRHLSLTCSLVPSRPWATCAQSMMMLLLVLHWLNWCWYVRRLGLAVAPGTWWQSRVVFPLLLMPGHTY